jgi:hypothetical protein
MLMHHEAIITGNVCLHFGSSLEKPSFAEFHISHKTIKILQNLVFSICTR